MTEWHVPDPVVTAFASAPRTLDDGVAASVEQHVAACTTCQDRVARQSSAFDLDAVWAEVEDRIDRHGVGWSGWLARLAGHSPSSRLVTATPGLQLSALGAATAAVAAATLASRTLEAAGVFLVLAPLVPLALVAASFAPGADPAGEAGLATPVYGIGLLVRRVFAIGLVSAVVLAAGTWALPMGGPRALAWVLPATAMAAVTLAASARWPVPRVAIVVAAVWVALLTGAARMEPGLAVTSSFVFDAAGQLLFAAATAAALAVIVNRRTAVCQEVF